MARQHEPACKVLGDLRVVLLELGPRNVEVAKPWVLLYRTREDDASPQPARWPKTIQPHEMLSMQRIVCAQTALSAPAVRA